MARSRSEIRRVWQERLADQVQSKLSVAEFCRVHGINPVSFYLWRRKFAVERKELASEHSERGLIPVRVVANATNENSSSQFIRIRFQSGVSIEAPCSSLTQAIEQLSAIEQRSPIKEDPHA